tara:strand:- start:194 stop:553 length:360 start_codon:yes stop_codon:yes gene_type:complete
MFVRIKDQIFNLDLIKKIGEIEVNSLHKSYYEEKDFHTLDRRDRIKSPDEEIRLLTLYANGNESQREYMIVYSINIYYLNEIHPERVVIGENRTEARKILEALVKRLNGNINGIEEITA